MALGATAVCIPDPLLLFRGREKAGIKVLKVLKAFPAVRRYRHFLPFPQSDANSNFPNLEWERKEERKLIQGRGGGGVAASDDISAAWTRS